MRTALHAIAAVLLWVVFVYYWTIVLRQPMNPETKTALLVLSVLTALCMLYLVGWIFHNRRIYRTMNRRRARRSVTDDTRRDFLGRLLVMDDIETLRRSAYIEVTVERDLASGRAGERKVFRARAANEGGS